MILFSCIYLSTNFLYLFLNITEIGYYGVFFLTIINLLYCSIQLFWKIYDLWIYNYSEEYIIFNWLDFGNNLNIFWNIKESFINNIIAFVMIFGATIVSIFVFFEMNNDKEGHNFIIVLGYFIIFMLLVIGSNNLILFYLGWEGISLTSYFLVNFWSERVRSIKAVTKIFIISKIGDFFIIIFISLIMKIFGTVDFDNINSIYILFLNNKFFFILNYINLNELLGVILLLGTCVKSAQYGFHIWLLEAMEAPLGASALMHSSTLVIAGVILLYKLSIVIEFSSYAQFLMFIMGSLSATMGSFLACFQFELKVILAYSTISNMGYIFILFSVGAYYEMIIILILHAFIKIYMFLVIGGIIYQSNGSQDIRWLGGLMVYTPFLWISYVIGGFSLIGLPYFSGYFYKNFLINSLINNLIYLKGGEFVLLISYFFTIFYVSRLGYLVFLNNKNGHKNIYKIKNFSIFYIISLFILGIVIVFGQYFWINLIYMNIKNISNSYFFNLFQNYQYYLYELTYLSSYFWILIYMFTLMFLFYLNFLNLNLNWNFFKNWSLLVSIFCFIFIFFVIV